MKIDQPRYAEWVRLSHRLSPFEAFMIVAVQGLGKIDAQLTAQDQEFLSVRTENESSIESSLELTDRFTQSYLWVLGAYEIIRAVDQRCRENAPSCIDASLVEAIKATKVFFERVRVPLAKFEAANKFKNTDSAIAFPALHPGDGIAWRVAHDIYITRQSMSDMFIGLLRKMPPIASLERVQDE